MRAAANPAHSAVLFAKAVRHDLNANDLDLVDVGSRHSWLLDVVLGTQQRPLERLTLAFEEP